MTDHFNLSFSNGEHDLYVWLQSQINPSKFIKDQLKESRLRNHAVSNAEQKYTPSPEVIHSLMQIFVGDDVKTYRGEREFLRIVNKQMLNNRVARLRQLHPLEADEVIKSTKEKYPLIGAML